MRGQAYTVCGVRPIPCSRRLEGIGLTLRAMKNKPSLRRTQRWTKLALLVAAIILLVIVVSMVLVSLTFHELVLGGRWALNSEWLQGVDVQSRAAALGQLGDYFGGTLGPILTFCSFLVLLVTVVLQRRQLEEGTRQLEQSTRAIDLEAFVRVHDTLNSPEGLAARARLQELAARCDPPVPFNQWTPDDQSAAVTVARQFELVGLLMEGGYAEFVRPVKSGSESPGDRHAPIT